MSLSDRSRNVWIALGASLFTLGGATPVAIWIAEKTAPTSGVILWPNPWTVLSIACLLVGTYIFAALLFDLRLPGSARAQASAKVQQQSDAERNAALQRKVDEQTRDRKRRILSELVSRYQAQYLTEHGDNIPHDVMMGTMHVPRDWINQRIAEMGEDWRV
jgi:type VI protein secretion system component VasK